MTCEQWESRVPETIKRDAIWKMEAYRLAVFLVDLAWQDVTKLMRDRRTSSHATQLYRSAGGISATLSEGFSRTTGKERARYYEFALGSARETRDWYFQSRHILGDKVMNRRIELATQIIRLTLKMIPDQRRNNRKLSIPPDRRPSRNHVIT